MREPKSFSTTAAAASSAGRRRKKRSSVARCPTGNTLNTNNNNNENNTNGVVTVRTTLPAGGKPHRRNAAGVLRAAKRGTKRGDAIGRRAIAMPEGDAEEKILTSWRRIGQEGVQKASEIWSAVNNEAAAAAKGAWEGVKPAHKVFLTDI